MSLQDQLLADFSHTLTDPDGPAQPCRVNGREVRAVIDRPARNTVEAQTGLLVSRLDLYIRREDLGFQPFAGQEVELDGETWQIETPEPHGPGTLKLGLARYLV